MVWVQMKLGWLVRNRDRLLIQPESNDGYIQ